MGTVTVWLCQFPSCTTALPCRNCNLSLTHHHQLLQRISSSSSFSQFHFRASQSTTSRTTTRKSRRLKSDAEICNDIRQFLASVGLPEDHIPSTKELLRHGRNDLANIVRRRGHKKIQELLTTNLTTSSPNVAVDSLHAENGLYETPDAANNREDLLTGQNENVDSLVDDVMASTEFLPGNSSSSLSVDSSPSSDECNSVSVESLASLSAESGSGELKDHTEVVSNATEGIFYPTEVTVVDNDRNSSRESFYPNFYSYSSMPTEISGDSSFETTSSGSSERGDSLVDNMVAEETLASAVPSLENHSDTSFDDPDRDTGDREFSHLEQKDRHGSEGPDDSNEIVSTTSFDDPDLDTGGREFSHSEQNDWCGSEGPDDSNENVAEDVLTTSEVSIQGNLSGGDGIDSLVHSTDSSWMNLYASANLSLEERVANFIQNGDLEPVEDHISAISNGDDYEESKEYIASEPVVDTPQGVHPSYDYNVTAANRNSLTSEVVLRFGTLDQPLPDDHMPHKDLDTNFDDDLDTEAPKVQNQSEINHLKFMLYQKELELSRLKEQIEKEKLALSVLQTKAEAEISKARKLISEKDAELNVAEESLSGLKEVQVDFCGDADVVEVAGSFNGWHHQIKMDPQPSTSATDIGGSRRSRFWSTTLWLYPGVYEIKFVVDGHWRTDPQRESVTRGHICNNILRVDK